MTKNQQRRYWALWGKARTRLIGAGFSSKEAAEHRDEITIETLGRRISSKKLNNDQLTQMFAAFEAIGNPGDLNAQLKYQQEPRDRRIYAIENTGLDDAYIASISQDMFNTSDWRNLPIDQLDNLRITAHNRARRKPVATPAPIELDF